MYISSPTQWLINEQRHGMGLAWTMIGKKGKDQYDSTRGTLFWQVLVWVWPPLQPRRMHSYVPC
jgi:hypothetical protein